jgi:ABC-type sulfate transport system permease component
LWGPETNGVFFNLVFIFYCLFVVVVVVVVVLRQALSWNQTLKLADSAQLAG